MTSSDTSEYVIILKELKKVMRQRGVTYKQISQSLGTSEVTVKRLFSAQDGSLNRLSEICQFFGFSLLDLASSLAKREVKVFKFSEKQEHFFSRNQNYFEFFSEIYERKLSIAEMKEKYQLNDHSIFKYLHGLDKLGLIQLQSNNRFRFCVEGKVSWITGGALQKLYLETMFDFPKYIVNQVMCGKLQIMKEVFLHIGDSYLSPQSIQVIFKLLMEVQKAIYKQSELDQVYSERKDLQKVSSFLCFSSFDRPKKGIINFGNL